MGRTPWKTKRKVLQTNCRKKTRKRWKKPSRRPLNGLMTTKRQKRQSLKKNGKNLKKLPIQLSRKFTRQVPVVKVLPQKKKTWMTKTATNFKRDHRIQMFDVQKQILARAYL